MNIVTLARTFDPESLVARLALVLRACIQSCTLLIKDPSRETVRVCLLSLRVIPFYTMTAPPHLQVLYRLGNAIREMNIEGDLVECGTWNGGSAAVMATAVRLSQNKRTLWLFDSFEGLPIPNEHDAYEARSLYYRGWCKGDVLKVQRIFAVLGIPSSMVRIVKGWFQDTLPVITIERISLLHIDADWHESVRLCLEHLFDHVVPGGFVVIDDYHKWEGCKKAVDSFFKERSLDTPLSRIPTGGIYFQKR